MSKVRFNLDKPNSEESYILLKFSYKGNRLRYSTGQLIKPEFWDTTTQRAKRTRKFAEYIELNQLLDDFAVEAMNIYRRHINDNKALTVQEFKKQLDIYRGRMIKDVKQTFFGFFDKFIEQRAKTFKAQTIKAYKTTLNHLQTYCKQNNVSLDFETINLNFYYDFLDYLYSEPNSLSANTANKHIRVLKTVLNEATQRGINKNLAYKNKNFKKPKQETDHIYLTLFEIEQIYKCDFSKNPRLERVRDLFTIGCYTGLRFSDFTNIQPENIRTIYNSDNKPVQVISITTEKTTQPVIIPLHPHVRAILKKYNNNIPTTLSNQKMNQYLKEVGEIAGLTENVIQARSIGGKRVDVTSRKSELITTHTARRSFATNAYKSGVSALSIMRITGHKTETAFMRYIKISNEENALLMADNSFFNNTAALRVA